MEEEGKEGRRRKSRRRRRRRLFKNMARDVLDTDDIISGLVMMSQTRSVTKW